MVGRTFLGRYEAIRQLGEGGMGRVYLAKQVDLGRQVVVKVMHEQVAEDPKFRDRFQCETLLMARFQHPYAVALYDASLNDPEGPCIVMEYIRGVSIDTLLQQNTRLTPARTGRLLGQLCEVLQAAHSQGIIHRDLKPANLMVVDPDTPYEKIKVMDFGLAKLIGSRSGALPKSADTGADFAVGTPGYISPEQVRGEEVTYRSDLYSVGVILFEMLTGRLPFTGDETMDVLLAHATEPPPSFEMAGASWVPPSIEAVVRSCLEKDPKERPAGARELWQRFEAALKQDAAEAALDTAHEVNHHGTAAKGKPKSEAELAESPGEVNGVAAPTHDPQAVTHRMEAWMPDAIAQYKLRGFVHDHGGEVLESAPGLIRVRLESRGGLRGGPLVWFGLSRKKHTLDMELRLERNNPQQQNLLHVTVVLRSPDRRAVAHPAWRDRCHQIFCDLRAYLAGASLE